MVNNSLIKPYRHTVVTAERVRMLFEHSPVAYMASLFAGGLVVIALRGYESLPVLLGWYAALALSTLVRFALTQAYRRSGRYVEDALRWENRMLLGTIFSSTAWASSLFILSSAADPSRELFLLLVLIGMTGGAVSIYAASIKVFLGFSMPILLAVGVRFWLDSSEFYAAALMLTLVYAGAITTMSRYYSRQIEQVLTLKEANEGLAGEVRTRSELESELRGAKQRFKDFAEAAADFFWELDADLNISMIAPNAADVLGEGVEALNGESWDALFSLPRCSADYSSLATRIEKHMSLEDIEFVWRNAEGEDVHLQLAGRPNFNSLGVFCGYRGVGRDITDRVKLLNRLRHQAQHDPLTGLLNRRAFMSLLGKYIESLQQNGASGVLCYFDLDHFKAVNDVAGHLVGDELIKQIAALLEQNLRDDDVVARFGGDEFVILFRGGRMHTTMQMSDRLLALLRDYRFTWGEDEFFIGASFGLVEISAKTQSTMTLLAEANMACTTAKTRGRNRIEVYNPEEQGQAERLAGLGHVTELRQALQEGQLKLMFQPIVPLMDSALESHMEVLLGMRNEDGKVESCGRRIQAAEHYGLMPEVDRWVIREAFKSYREHTHDCFPVLGINLSGSSLGDRQLFDYIEHQLRVTGIPANKVCFEITETAAIHNLRETQRLIDKLKAIGVRFALDDFGSGLANFSYLKHLPVDYLKIDGSFVRNIATDASDRAMVAAMAQLARQLGMVSVGEFVESLESLEMLKELGVDYGQGYKLGRPSHDLDKVLLVCRDQALLRSGNSSVEKAPETATATETS